ncbi:MAG: hypothetical protein WD824_21825 [Cyclobacteriaceae bacterium]
MIHQFLPFAMLALLTGPGLMAQSTEKRKQYLKDILEINIPQRFQQTTRRVTFQDSTWTDWLHRTGELPPDFSIMPSKPFLPDPLMLNKKGKDHPVKNKADWQEKREWIKAQYAHWISGTAPPAPADFKVEVLSERQESRTRIQMFEIKFGPGYRGRMTVELMIPPGDGPFPVYLTQWNHRGWAQLAVRRGYMGCVYAAADIKDDTEAYQALYPDYDWSALMRRAWGASRVVDYLLIISPDLDRHADLPSVKKSIESVKAVYYLYQKGDQLVFDSPREINRMTTGMNETVADFFRKLIE